MTTSEKEILRKILSTTSTEEIQAFIDAETKSKERIKARKALSDAFTAYVRLFVTEEELSSDKLAPIMEKSVEELDKSLRQLKTFTTNLGNIKVDKLNSFKVSKSDSDIIKNFIKNL